MRFCILYKFKLMLTKSYVGKAIKCTETGKIFLGKSNGFTYNYAHDSEGNLFSDNGVFIRENRSFLLREKVGAYTDTKGENVTTWKGQSLARITWKTSINNGFAGKSYAINCVDNHGQKWRGRTSGFGMFITLHPMKG